jgi:predicted signal transduction protein with EAL and GGDEF domain
VLARVRLRYERRLNREPVTGLLNRSGLVARVDELVLHDYVKGENPSRFGLVFVSVESMLNINRDLGRQAYEGATRELARRLVTAFGAGDVGRLEGEGAVIVVPGLTQESALAAGEKAVRLLVPAVEVRGIPFDPEPAGGVALSPADGRDLGALLGQAESAMREARRAGVPAVVSKGPQTDQANRRFDILAEVRRVLFDADRGEEVGLHYQPQVELGSGRLYGVEALVRWHHPLWGLVPPDVLIDAIERSAVMHQLTLHLLDKAVRQVAVWNSRGSPIRVAVNASVRDLLAPAFADEIEAMLLTHGVAPGQLTIEITESMLVGGDPRVARTASRIADLGVGLAIDDFGTGYASIDQLRNWPLTEVKIDKSYVANVVTHPAEWALVESVHGLARALGLHMVAEGVQDEQTATALARLPGTIGQGWHFGRPMTAAALEDWLARPAEAA